MSTCEKYDVVYSQLVAEGYTTAELNSLAEFCIIADEFKNKSANADILWQGYCHQDNGITILKNIKDRFEKLV